MGDRWNTDTERHDMTVWLFDEESFVPMAMIKEGRSYSILTDQLEMCIRDRYDPVGRVVHVLDFDGNDIRLSYDGIDNLTEYRDNVQHVEYGYSEMCIRDRWSMEHPYRLTR